MKDETLQPTPSEIGTFEEEGNPLDEMPDENVGTDIPDVISEDGEDGDVPDEPVEPDYKEKFGHSTRENQLLAGKLADNETRLGEIMKADPPTESELKAEFPDWDIMTATEQRMAKETLTLRKKVASSTALLLNVADDLSFNRRFNEVVNARKDDGSYVFAGIRERSEQFYEYCMKPTHKGASLQTLARAFLFELKDELPKSRKLPPAKPSLARSGTGKAPHSFAPSTAGKRVMSTKEASTLRTRDPKTYMELMRKKLLVIKD